MMFFQVFFPQFLRAGWLGLLLFLAAPTGAETEIVSDLGLNRFAQAEIEAHMRGGPNRHWVIVLSTVASGGVSHTIYADEKIEPIRAISGNSPVKGRSYGVNPDKKSLLYPIPIVSTETATEQGIEGYLVFGDIRSVTLERGARQQVFVDGKPYSGIIEYYPVDNRIQPLLSKELTIQGSWSVRDTLVRMRQVSAPGQPYVVGDYGETGVFIGRIAEARPEDPKLGQRQCIAGQVWTGQSLEAFRMEVRPGKTPQWLQTVRDQALYDVADISEIAFSQAPLNNILEDREVAPDGLRHVSLISGLWESPIGILQVYAASGMLIADGRNGVLLLATVAPDGYRGILITSEGKQRIFIPETGLLSGKTVMAQVALEHEKPTDFALKQIAPHGIIAPAKFSQAGLECR